MIRENGPRHRQAIREVLHKVASAVRAAERRCAINETDPTEDG